jgi:hypothetical protein
MLSHTQQHSGLAQGQGLAIRMPEHVPDESANPLLNFFEFESGATKGLAGAVHGKPWYGNVFSQFAKPIKLAMQRRCFQVCCSELDDPRRLSSFDHGHHARVR